MSRNNTLPTGPGNTCMVENTWASLCNAIHTDFYSEAYQLRLCAPTTNIQCEGSIPVEHVSTNTPRKTLQGLQYQ